MKYLFLVVFLFSICFGQYPDIDSNYKNPVHRMKERREYLDKQIELISKIINPLNDKEAEKVFDFLKREAVIIAPTVLNDKVHFVVGEKAKSNYCFFVCVLFEEDLSLSMEFGSVNRQESIGASYNPDDRVIYLKTWVNLSEAWASICLLHESFHAYENIFTPYDWENINKYLLHEKITHEFQNRLVAKLGGEEYSAVLGKELKKTKNLVDSKQFDWKNIFANSSNVQELDVIFGNPKSRTEKISRNTHFYIHKNFVFYDRECDTKEEADSYKKMFLLNLYIKRGIVKR